MGNMSEEMKKVMAKWNSTNQPQESDQPTNQGATVQSTNNPAFTEPGRQYNSYRSEIYDIVKKNPGLTCTQVLEKMNVNHPELGHSSISSQLTVMFQEFMLSREMKLDPRIGRKIYFYSALDLKDAERLRKERDKKLAQAQARMERARQAKAEKAKAKTLILVTKSKNEGQMPLPFDAPQTVTATALGIVPPVPTVEQIINTAPDLRNMTGMEILQAINFAQAKELYKELKEAFGG